MKSLVISTAVTLAAMAGRIAAAPASEGIQDVRYAYVCTAYNGMSPQQVYDSCTQPPPECSCIQDNGMVSCLGRYPNYCDVRVGQRGCSCQGYDGGEAN
ncbi:hypothetical protein F5Y10DRAFT_292502 [Nemania abortiva]|nr:hypothetical protein F5Y10DRAFT_292502 [Nemania abortiva]